MYLKMRRLLFDVICMMKSKDEFGASGPGDEAGV